MMSTSIANKKTMLLVFIFLLILLFISIFSTSNAPKEYPSYVSESPSQTGTKALYTYLEQEIEQVLRENIHPSHLNDKPTNSVRLLVDPPIFTDQVIQESYLEYIRAGNTLVVWKNNPDGLFGLQTMPVEEWTATNDEKIMVHIDSSVYEAERNSPFRIQLKQGDHSILEDQHGALAIERNLGNGKLIAAVEPNWLVNDRIAEHDHMALILETVPFQEAEKIIFDESIYNGSSGFTAQFSLYPNWVYVLLIEGLLLTILWLWYKGKRFGPIIQPREDTVRFSDERLKALTNWYLKGNNYQASIQDQANYLKEVMKENYGIPYRKNWDERLAVLENKIENMSANELKQFAFGLESLLQQKSLNKQEYMNWSKRIETLQKEVERR